MPRQSPRSGGRSMDRSPASRSEGGAVRRDAAGGAAPRSATRALPAPYALRRSRRRWIALDPAHRSQRGERRRRARPSAAPTRATAASSTASMRATISAMSSGRPKTIICAACCSQRAAVLSSDMSNPALSCARARSSSAGASAAESLRISAQRTGISSATSVLAGAGIDAEDAAVAIGVGEGIDGIDEAALLADLLEEARRHAAAERASRAPTRRSNRGSAKRKPGKPSTHMDLFEVALLAEFAADIARGLARARPALRRQRRELRARASATSASWSSVAGGRQQHARRGVMALHIAGDRVAIDAADDLGACRAPGGPSPGRERRAPGRWSKMMSSGVSIAWPISCRITARSRSSSSGSKAECCRMSARMSTRQRHVLLQHLGVIGGVLARRYRR